MDKEKIEKIIGDIEQNLVALKEEVGVELEVTTEEMEYFDGPFLELDIDFDMAKRAFIKEYSRGKSGSAVFTIIVAYLAKGESAERIKYEKIKKVWESCEGLIQPSWSTTHGSRAKEKDWVSSPEPEVYKLRPSWQEALKDE